MLSFTFGCAFWYACTPGRRVESTQTVIGALLSCATGLKLAGADGTASPTLFACPQALRPTPAMSARTASAHFALALGLRCVRLLTELIDQHLSGLSICYLLGGEHPVEARKPLLRTA